MTGGQGFWNPIPGGGGTGDAAWIEPTLTSGTNFGGSHARVAYRKDGNGFVHIKGLVNTPGTSSIFTLPAGYRPNEQHIYGPPRGPGTGTTTRLDITSSGAVTPVGGDGGSWVSLAGITFYADA